MNTTHGGDAAELLPTLIGGRRLAAIDDDGHLANVAVPLLKQAQAILKAEGRLFSVHSPVDSARLMSDGSPNTFLEFVMDSSGAPPQVMGRVTRTRGKRTTVEERPLAEGKAIQDLGDDDVAAFLVAEIPRLVSKAS